jgi:hypothetical protein
MDVNINSRINVHFVLFLTYGGIKKEIIATTFTIFTFKKRQQSCNRKKVTSFLTIFLDISLSTSNVSGNVVLASLGFSVGISSPK